MPTPPFSPLHQTISATCFEQLNTLLQRTVSMQSDDCCIVTEQMAIAVSELTTAQPTAQRSDRMPTRFVLVVSETFSALLTGYKQHPPGVLSSHSTATSTASPEKESESDAESESGVEPRSGAESKSGVESRLTKGQPESSPYTSKPDTPRYIIDLTFDPRAIAAFIRDLCDDIPGENTLHSKLRHALTLLQANSPGTQTEFTLELIHVLAEQADPNPLYSSRSSNFAERQFHIVDSSLITDLDQRTQVFHDAMLAAQAADQAKSEFLAAMSHELRTPLTYILGMSSTLLRWSSHTLSQADHDDLKDRQQQYLQNIHRQGEHLLELINDILDLSQLESGKMGLVLEDFSLSVLVQQTLKSYIAKAKHKNIRLELDIHIPPQLDQFVADPRRIRQIILNLLSNAIKFTNAGGSVTLRALALEDSVVIQVKDTGIGIPDHLQSDIFQKFRQLDSSYRREYDGTGLGLALTKQLVELHGGSIECHSTLGIGTVFTVTLPRYPSVPLAYEKQVRAKSKGYQPLGRIVLIESQEENAHMISDMLMAAGYQLIWMLEGSTAVSQIEVLQPAVVLVSTSLPDTDSRDMISRLRLNPLTKKLNIIALSSNAATTDQQKYREAGADDILMQPIRPDELLHRVGTAIAQSAPTEQ
ncbi:MAG: ATP-binding protein [Leptolyngbyaceae bacterium]|nr:ATP-binding protein [Leptolyngbyaceae bacterium]